MTLSNNKRMCVITRERKHKSELIKITRIKDKWYVDHEQKLFGRSIYLDLDKNVLKKFSKQSKRFKFEKSNFEEIIEQLEELI